MDITRYSIEPSHFGDVVAETEPDGEWVRYTDVADVRAAIWAEAIECVEWFRNVLDDEEGGLNLIRQRMEKVRDGLVTASGKRG